MKRTLALLLLLFPALAPAAEKILDLAPGKAVSFIAPDGWTAFRKENPPPGFQMVRRDSPDGRTSLQVMVMAIRPGSPLAGGSDIAAELRKLHDLENMQYVQEGAERKDGPRTVQQAHFQGLVSTFTDRKYGDKAAPPGEFKHVTRATYLMGPLKEGVLLSIVILTNDLAGADYAAALAAANSFGPPRTPAP